MTTTDLETEYADRDAALDTAWQDWEPPGLGEDPDVDGFPALAAEVDRDWVTERARWLKGIRREQARNAVIVQRRLDQLHAEIAWTEARAVEVDRVLAGKASWIEGLLKAYAILRRCQSGGREKTTKLLDVTVSTRESAEQWEVLPKLVEAWARREYRPEVYVEKVTRVIDKDIAVELMRVHGELVDGVIHHRKGEKVTAEVTVEGIDV